MKRYSVAIRNEQMYPNKDYQTVGGAHKQLTMMAYVW